MNKIKTVVYVIVVLFLAANLYMSFQIQNKLNHLEITVTPKKSLPCESVPLNWAVTNYECANSLLLAMNVTNVKFEAPGTSYLTRYNKNVSTHKS